LISLPIDQAERVAVRDDHGRSVFVEAGAGTGKTTAIVARVVAMVATGWLELRDLAAITFTEAAASELRDRIREGLEAASDDRDPTVTAPDDQERCRRALHQLDEAALTTLHGFAQRILSDHPLEAGLPPGFEVLDPIRARVELEQRWAAFVDEIFADPALEAILLRGLALALGPEDLHAIALELDEHHDRLTVTPPVEPTLPPLSVDAIVDALDVLLAHRRDDCRNDDDRLAVHIDGLRTWRETLERARDEFDIIDLLVEAPRLRFNQGRKDCWKVDVAIVRDATATVATLVESTLLTQRLAVLELLTARVLAFVKQAADARRVAGTLEFHDLLVFARDLLRRDPEVRAEVAARYRCLLLDEFQDTDPLQIELAVLLTTDDPDAGSKPWSEVVVRPGALVVVGDPKQSIYRFRRADLRVYHRAREGLALQTHTLVENFRSVPAVIDFVNHVFVNLLEEDPGVQAEHVELHAHRGSVGPDEPVGVFGTAADGRVADIRAREADDVAAIVRQVKDQGWQIQDPITHEVRDAQYKDIALLIPSRTVLPALEDALERADVPVRVESQSLVFSTAEVRDLLAALSAVDDPTDEIAVVAALRSPGFGCSDAELMEFVRLGGHWDYRRDAPEGIAADHRVVAGLVALRDYWEQRWWRTVSETTEAIVRERHLLELALTRRRPRDHWRRIRYLLDQARAWDDAGDASLRAFVEWVQQQADERARVMESVTPEPDDDALRILTVHGSKGLEFPVVLLAGLNTLPVRAPRSVIWGDRGPEFGVGTKRGNRWAQTPGYDAAATEEDRHEEAERLRLLYVAMTRARDHLVLSLHHKTDSDCHAARVAARLTGSRLTLLAPDAPEPLPRGRVGKAPTSADPDVRARWLTERATAVARAAQPASVSATALAHMDEQDKEEVESDISEPWRRGRAGTAVGRAVHAVLQTIDLVSGADLAATARAQAFAEEVPDREAEIRALVESVLRAPIVQSATAAGARCWREVPVGARIDGVLVEGFIDLLVEDASGFTVVDYKTDQVPSDTDIAEAVRRYTPQAAAYALALEAVLGQRVQRCVFVFARADGTMEREVPDLPGAVAEVRERLQRAQSAALI
jgi:ATP-dependent helicase/nuclease subunit A